jgi:MoaA/NifB/PqqE/SkfB family radical SAM enzyme
MKLNVPPTTRWYREPSNLILFNTACLTKNNPLIVLSDRGARLWEQIIAGWSVDEIREEFKKELQNDSALRFIQRLCDLGLLVTDSIVKMESGENAIADFKEIPAPQFQFSLTQAIIPWYCIWEICSVCDLSCRGCYVKNKTKKKPSMDHSMAIARSLVSAGIFYISIVGGEPLLFQGLSNIIRWLRERNVFVKIITNGQALNSEWAFELKDAGLNQLEVSFDGCSFAFHDLSRGKGTFKKASRAIQIAIKSEIPRVGISLTVHSESFKDLMQLPIFMQELNVRECYISLYKEANFRINGVHFLSPTAEQVAQLHALISLWKENFPQLEICLLPTCTCGRTSVVVAENGDIRVCPFSTKTYGNILENPLLDIWHSIGDMLPKAGPFGFCANEIS